MSNIESVQEPKVELKRSLSLPLLVMFGLAYLAPTVVFNYYGIITVSTGGMMALAYAVTTVVMFFTAFSYARMAEAFPQAGSAYTYVQKSIDPHLGFLTGWVMLLDYLLIPMICYLLLGVYVNEYFPAIPIWSVVIAVAAIGAVINVIGIKTATIIDTVIIAAQIGFSLLLLIVIAKFVTGGGGAGTMLDRTAIFNPETFQMNGLLTASAILCVSFLGFDAVTTLSEEAKNQKKNVPKAIMIVAVGAGILFVIISYFTQLAWPTAYMEIQNEDAGIFELLGERINAPFMSDVFFITDNFASFICAMAGLAAVSRILYSMGRDNILPKKFFGKLSPRFRTPVNNILLSTVVALSALFYQDNLFGAVSLISFGAITGFTLVNLSSFFHYFVREKRRGSSNFFRYVIMPWIGVAVCVALWINIEPIGKIVGCIWLALGFIYLIIKTKGFKELPPEMNLEE